MKFLVTTAVIFLAIFFILPNIKGASSADYTEDSKRLKEIQDQINELEKQLNAARGQENTLKSQLSFIDTQAKLTQLKIDETNTQIAKLDLEISDLTNRITRLSTTVDTISQVLLNRITQTYKYGNTTSLELLFSSNGFADLIERFKYLQVAQTNDKKVLYQLQATKATYNDQKTDKQTRQAQQEKLKKDLAAYQIQLADQKTAKENLLKITQNSEALYQAKILAARQEQQAILAILNGEGNEVADGPVKTNEVIGHMLSGRSPCSGGTHLHFEVHQGKSIQDPNNYLASVGFQYVDNDGGKSEGPISPHGSWSNWPIFEPIEITQGFGMTPYASGLLDGIKHYAGGPHTGIDMWTPPGNLAVKAVSDGTLYTGQLNGICSGGPLRYKKIDLGNGLSALYLHVQ